MATYGGTAQYPSMQPVSYGPYYYDQYNPQDPWNYAQAHTIGWNGGNLVPGGPPREGSFYDPNLAQAQLMNNYRMKLLDMIGGIFKGMPGMGGAGRMTGFQDTNSGQTASLPTNTTQQSTSSKQTNPQATTNPEKTSTSSTASTQKTEPTQTAQAQPTQQTGSYGQGTTAVTATNPVSTQDITTAQNAVSTGVTPPVANNNTLTQTGKLLGGQYGSREGVNLMSNVTPQNYQLDRQIQDARAKLALGNQEAMLNQLGQNQRYQQNLMSPFLSMIPSLFV